MSILLSINALYASVGFSMIGFRILKDVFNKIGTPVIFLKSEIS